MKVCRFELILTVLLTAAACSSSSGPSGSGGATGIVSSGGAANSGGTVGSGATGGAASAGASGAVGAGHGGTGVGGTGAIGAGGAAGAGHGGMGAAGASAGADAGGSAGAGHGGMGAAGAGGAAGSADPYATARQTCIDKINALRATKTGLSPYAEWMSAEACVDQEATADEMSGAAHGAWLSNTYSCNGNGQNECEGQGAAGIAACLQSMWDEKDQPGCAGCDACAAKYTQDCANCDFYGTVTGHECGHYVNLSAEYLTQAACGFSSLGGWAAINFK